MVLTGVVVPVSSLPEPLRHIALGLPITHGLQAFRDAWTGASFSAVLPEVAREFIVAAGYGIAGYTAFRVLEVWVRGWGTLEHSPV